jgi:hypothetical protein
MPVIRVTCPENVLTSEQKEQLAPLLIDAVMTQEVDPVTDVARNATFLVYHEIIVGIRPRHPPTRRVSCGSRCRRGDRSRRRDRRSQRSSSRRHAAVAPGDPSTYG